MKDKQAVRDLILALAIVIVASGLYIGNRIMNRKPAVIVEVSVDGVVVEELDLSKAPGLKMVDCGYNLITGLDLSGNPSMQEVYCNDSVKLSGAPHGCYIIRYADES